MATTSSSSSRSSTSSSSSSSARQGPQRPGYSFNSGGGSVNTGGQSIGGGASPFRPGTPSTNTPISRGGGGGGSSGGGGSTPISGGQSIGGGASLIQGPVRPGETSVSGVSISNRPIGVNVQAASQRAGEAALLNTRANVNAQDDALNRDSNYAWKTFQPQSQSPREILMAGMTGQKVDNTNSLSGVQSFLSSESAKDYLTGVAERKASANLIGLNLPANPLLSGVQSFQESQTKSMVAPDVLSFAGFARQGKITPTEYSFGATKSLQQKYTELYQKESTAAFNFRLEQEKKNIDLTNATQVGEANLRLQGFAENYPKQWEQERGQFFQASAGKILADVNLESSYLGVKQALPSITAKGAGIGAIATVGGLALGTVVSAPVVAGIGATALVVGGGYAAYEYGKAGLSGLGTFKESKGLGFTTGESLSRGLLSGATTIAPAAFASAGAVAGAGATMGVINLGRTGSVLGYTKTDIANINKISNRPDAFKLDLIKGITTDTSSLSVGNKIGQAKIVEVTGEGPSLVSGGSTLRQYKVSLNLKGLTDSELLTASKFNLRGTTIQSTTQQGQFLSGFELTNIKTGGLFGPKTSLASTFEGTSTKNLFTGSRQFLSQTGKNSIFGTEIIKGRGNVKYEGLGRAEISSGESLRLGTLNINQGKGFTILDQQPKITGKTIDKTFFTSKGFVGSKYTGGSLSGNQLDGVSTATYGKTYTDVIGKGLSSKELIGTNFNVINTPSKSFRTVGGGEGSQGLVMQQIVKTSFTPMVASTGLKPALQINQPSAIISPYYGSGQYETTSFGKLTLGGGKLLPPTTSSTSINRLPQGNVLTPPREFSGVSSRGKTEVIGGLSFGTGSSLIDRQAFGTGSVLKIGQISKQIQQEKQLIPLKTIPFSTGLTGGFGPEPIGRFGLPPIGLPSLGGFAIGKPRSLGMKSKEMRIAPSFSAIVGNKYATKSIGVSKTFGVNPFTSRGMYSKKVGVKNYIKEIDF